MNLSTNITFGITSLIMYCLKKSSLRKRRLQMRLEHQGKGLINSLKRIVELEKNLVLTPLSNCSSSLVKWS